MKIWKHNIIRQLKNETTGIVFDEITRTDSEAVATKLMCKKSFICMGNKITVLMAETMKDRTESEVEIKQLVKASKISRRYGLYLVKISGKKIGVVEKAFHNNSYRVGNPCLLSSQSFSSLKSAVNYLVEKQN